MVLLLVAAGVASYFLFFSKGEAAEITYFSYTLEDYFLTNVKDSTSLLKTSIAFEIEERDKEQQQAFLAENESAVRDTVLFLLRDKTYDELRSLKIQETLSNEIVQGLEQRLGIDYIEGVYFNEYVVQ